MSARPLEQFDYCFLIEDDEDSGWARGDTCTVLDPMGLGTRRWIVEMSDTAMLRRLEAAGLTFNHPSARLFDETPVFDESVLRRVLYI